MKNTISRKQAVEVALRRYKEGANYSIISKELAAAGYRSLRTKTPLTPGGVNRLIYPFISSTKRAKPLSRRKVVAEEDALSVVKSICSSSIPDERKVRAIKEIVL